MAKLSARGRTELARIVRKETIPDGNTTKERRTTLALMSDRTILEKFDVTYPDGMKNSFSWKVRTRKVKADVTPEQFIETFAKHGFVRA